MQSRYREDATCCEKAATLMLDALRYSDGCDRRLSEMNDLQFHRNRIASWLRDAQSGEP
jgi:hypothetical protein